MLETANSQNITNLVWALATMGLPAQALPLMQVPAMPVAPVLKEAAKSVLERGVYKSARRSQVGCSHSLTLVPIDKREICI